MPAGRQRDSTFGYGAQAIGLSTEAFALLRDLIAARTGLYFDDAKRDLLADKLVELVAGQGMSSFLDYYYLLKYDAGAGRHWTELMDRLSVPETYFWRQADQLLALARTLVPEHAARRPGQPLRIWSAACCTGEEPLSILIALAEAGWLDRVPVELVASDGSPVMVERARRGLYRERSFRSLPPELRSRYFRAEAGGWRVDPELHGRIRWRVANLAQPAEAGPLAAADVVFCRNVFIYFSDDAIRRVADVLWERMPAPGHLFLGTAESLARLGSRFELEEIDGAFVYTKRAGAPDGVPAVPGPLTRRAPAVGPAPCQEG